MFSHGNGPIATAVRLVTSLAAVAIGLKAFNMDVEAMLHIEQWSYALRMVVGFCGAYSLLAFVLSCCNDCGSCKVNQ